MIVFNMIAHSMDNYKGLCFLKVPIHLELNRHTQNDRPGVMNYIWPIYLDKERHYTFIDHLIWRLCIYNCNHAMLLLCYWSRFEPAQRGRQRGGMLFVAWRFSTTYMQLIFYQLCLIWKEIRFLIHGVYCKVTD